MCATAPRRAPLPKLLWADLLYSLQNDGLFRQKAKWLRQCLALFKRKAATIWRHFNDWVQTKCCPLANIIEPRVNAGTRQNSLNCLVCVGGVTQAITDNTRINLLLPALYWRQWRSHTRCIGCVRTPCHENMIFWYMIYAYNMPVACVCLAIRASYLLT